MMEFEFIRAVSELTRGLTGFPLPAIVADRSFAVYWSNKLAKTLYPHITGTQGLRDILAEYDPAGILEQLESSGNCTIGDIVPLTGVCMSLSPIIQEGQVAGAVVLLMGPGTLLNGGEYHHSSKTAAALTSSIRRAVGDAFDAMDVASGKADVLDMGWIKPNLQRLEYYGYRILRIADNVTEYARFQGGNLVLRTEPVDIFALLAGLSATITAMAAAVEIPVSFQVPDVSAYACIDVSRVELVLLNILHNALYFTKPGNHVTVTAFRCGGVIHIKVADRGRGIPSGLLAQIFRPYFAYDQDGPAQTTGLGLTLAKLITQAHGGAVAVDSQPGLGTTVTLTLPESPLSQPIPLGQSAGLLRLDDRFSRVYTGLGDLMAGPP